MGNATIAMKTNSQPLTPPNVFWYAVIFPVTLTLVAVSLSATGIQVGVDLKMEIKVGAVVLICWLFARRHRRHFSRSEYWRMFMYCVTWAVLWNAPVVVETLANPNLSKEYMLHGSLLLTAMLAIGLDGLSILLGLWIGGGVTSLYLDGAPKPSA
jgi:hypothetical protein